MRNAFHVLISLALWGLFGYYWVVVSRRELARTTIEALSILLVIIVVGILLTLWWVSHNKKLARRNRRNSPPPVVPEAFEHDTLGRELVRPDARVLQRAQIIDISLEERPADGGENEEPRKVYQVVQDGGRP